MFKSKKSRTSLAKIVLFSAALTLSIPRVYANEIPRYERALSEFQSEEKNEGQEFFKEYVNLVKRLTPQVFYTPVLYAKKPTRTEKQKLMLKEKGINVEMIDKGDAVESVCYSRYILNKYKNDKELLRSAFLPSGYFFTENVYLANWLYWNTRLDTFFNDREIKLVRGDSIFTLVKRKDMYYYQSSSGPRAYFSFNDKVGTGLEEVLSNYNHIDLKKLQKELKFNTLEVISSSDDCLEMELNYSNTDVKGILRFKEGRAEFFPSSIAEEEYESLLEEKKEFFNFVEKLKSQVRQFRKDGLFFDEPEAELEDEQLDGLLRELWADAYYKGETEYSFRDTTYSVFAKNGNVKIPQVCTDFIIDAFESAGGSWFNPYGMEPGRTEGFLDFKKILRISDKDLRRVSKLILNAKKHEDKFEYFGVPGKNMIPFEKEGFYENLFYLIDHGMDLQPLDVIVLYGPLEDEKMHYHSMIVSNVDPLTGFPAELMENPDRVQFMNFGKILSRAEKRWVHGRIRIKPEWIMEQKNQVENEVL